MPRRSVPGVVPRVVAALTALTALSVLSVLVVAGCGEPSSVASGSGSEGSEDLAPWGALGPGGLDDSPDGLVPGPIDPGPQVMAEITLPGGAVPTVPQPTVPAPEVFVTPAVADPGSVTLPGAGVRGAAVPTTAPPPPEASARAVERLGDDGLRSTAARALGRVRYDWQRNLPGWQVRFLPGRSGVRGYTYPDSRVIEVFVRDSDSPEALAHVVAHELGHAVDVTHLDDGERAAWRSARRIPAAAPWFPGRSGETDFASGAGDFAESFAWVSAGPPWFSELGPPPDGLQSALIGRLASP